MKWYLKRRDTVNARPVKAPSQEKHTNRGTGYDALAQAIVNTAIEDIRACSKKDIRRYEDPEYRARLKHGTRKMVNYFDAKSFLLGDRMTGLSIYDGEEIWEMLMKEKGIEE